jgi:hypothetical protein
MELIMDPINKLFSVTLIPPISKNADIPLLTDHPSCQDHQGIKFSSILLPDELPASAKEDEHYSDIHARPPLHNCT